MPCQIFSCLSLTNVPSNALCGGSDRPFTQEEQQFFTCLAGIFPAWEQEDDNFGSATAAAITKADPFFGLRIIHSSRSRRRADAAWRPFSDPKMGIHKERLIFLNGGSKCSSIAIVFGESNVRPT